MLADTHFSELYLGLIQQPPEDAQDESYEFLHAEQMFYHWAIVPLLKEDEQSVFP